ncbi:hypothetical protein [Sphingomonas immobilis]|uniref:Uncharacterized protein n=1 Tax=Sphingomonas immobilis TaxID=3063997 RepID=A0ABT9A5R0_9SPHN|nr:hypothetical protein [Sphingomonas sp. CA1-15]MDO7844087.1 hypothetical protein [Sphingomonas sp. CA1-15]
MMHQPHEKPSKPMESLRATMLWLAFGIGVLAFLVAIGRPEWFHLRPASGTAVALSLAAQPHPEPVSKAQP